MRIGHLLIAVALALTASPSLASPNPVPLKSYDQVTFATSSGAAVTLDQVRSAIVRGGAVRGWVMKEVSPTEFEATIMVRSHTVGVNLSFDTKSFSIKYRTSENMNYEIQAGRPVIHPKYNSWLDNLVGDIRKELSKV